MNNDYLFHEKDGAYNNGQADAYSKVLQKYIDDLPRKVVDWLYEERSTARLEAIAAYERSLEVLREN